MFFSMIKTLGAETTTINDEASVPSSSCRARRVAVSSEYYTVSRKVTNMRERILAGRTQN
jgi:hypothetical protein